MMKNSDIYISYDEKTIRLPVLPDSYSDERSHEVKTFETVEGGEISVIGREKLKKLSFSSYLPSEPGKYTFQKAGTFGANDIVKFILEAQNSDKPVRVIMTGTDINFMYAIESFETNQTDGTGDIYYTISFVEYKELNIKSEKNKAPIHKLTGLRERPKSTGRVVKPIGKVEGKKTVRTSKKVNVKNLENNGKSLYSVATKLYKKAKKHVKKELRYVNKTYKLANDMGFLKKNTPKPKRRGTHRGRDFVKLLPKGSSLIRTLRRNRGQS